jgi:hypothetical protein
MSFALQLSVPSRLQVLVSRRAHGVTHRWLIDVECFKELAELPMVHRRIPLVVSSPLRLEPDHRCAAITVYSSTPDSTIQKTCLMRLRAHGPSCRFWRYRLRGPEADQPRAVKVGEYSSKVMHDTIRAIAELYTRRVGAGRDWVRRSVMAG